MISLVGTMCHVLKRRYIGQVKSGKFGRSAKFGQRPCLIPILNIEIKNKLTKQTVKILMRRLIRSRLIWISTVCKSVSEFTRCPKLPDFTLSGDWAWFANLL